MAVTRRAVPDPHQRPGSHRQPSRHQPLRPSWRCVACDDAWPCQLRCRELLVEYDGSRVLLALYLARYVGEAAADHPHIPASVLYARFVGWVRWRC